MRTANESSGGAIIGNARAILTADLGDAVVTVMRRDFARAS
jgi:hypothetical protein